MIHRCGCHQAADQIARDVAGDIGGKGARRLRGAALLCEVRERERECGRHKQALQHAQSRKAAESWRVREEDSRNCERREGEHHALAALDVAAVEGDTEAADRHPQRRRVNRKPHRRRAYAVRRGERGQDRLRREEIDQREERRRGDQRCAGGDAHVTSSFRSSCRRPGRGPPRSAWRARCRCSATSAKCRSSPARRRPPCARSAPRSCSHTR